MGVRFATMKMDFHVVQMDLLNIYIESSSTSHRSHHGQLSTFLPLMACGGNLSPPKGLSRRWCFGWAGLGVDDGGPGSSKAGRLPEEPGPLKNPKPFRGGCSNT